MRLTTTRFLTRAEVAEQIGVSRPTLARMIRDEEISHLKVGSLVRISQQDVDDFLAANRVPAKKSA